MAVFTILKNASTIEITHPQGQRLIIFLPVNKHYEIVNEARPLSEFIPTDADFC